MRFLFLLLGGGLGYEVAASWLPTMEAASQAGLAGPRGLFLGILLGGLIGFLFSPLLVTILRQAAGWITGRLNRVPLTDIAAGVVGLLVALVIAVLFTLSFPRQLPVIGDYLPLFFTAFMGYIGTMVAVKKKDEVLRLLTYLPRSTERLGREGRDVSSASGKTAPKILDTSVIIDGRIFDIGKTGFVEGPLVIPGFVLAELQHIADSSDVLKRNRGRRGLDILNRMRKELNLQVQILDQDFDELSDVDAKIIRLARQLGGKVITNDYNLNKVCELQGVPVLNINELANALKPIVLPGEEMVVQVIKDGKEMGQGVAYLDDGTMIVVDGGRKYIGETIGVLVTSVLQTAAGRMIFAKPKPVEKAL